jgi:hypothetical protein
VREPAAFCHACGQVIEGAAILFTAHGERICAACAPPVPSAADVARARLVFLTRRARQRRHLRAAIALLWVLAGAFAAGSVRTIPPVFTIDSPAPESGVPGQIRLTGRAATQTIRRPLWLFIGPDAASCAPIEEVPIEIAPDGRWHADVELKGPRSARFWVVVVLTDQAGRVAYEERQQLPEWLGRHDSGQQGGRGCRRHSRASWKPPADATLLASFDLTLTEDHGLGEWLHTMGIFDYARDLSNDLRGE